MSGFPPARRLRRPLVMASGGTGITSQDMMVRKERRHDLVARFAGWCENRRRKRARGYLHSHLVFLGSLALRIRPCLRGGEEI